MISILSLQPACPVPGRQPHQRGARVGGILEPAAGPGPVRQPDRDPAHEHCAPEEPQVLAPAQEPTASSAQGHCGLEESNGGKDCYLFGLFILGVLVFILKTF